MKAALSIGSMPRNAERAFFDFGVLLGRLSQFILDVILRSDATKNLLLHASLPIPRCEFPKQKQILRMTAEGNF